MGIVDEDIRKVRESADIVQVVSQYTQLKRVGRRFSGLCPFHNEKTGSFSVNAEEGLYYCFGCQVRGDVITFVREKEQLDFVGAVEWLANKFGVQLHYTDVNEGEDRKRRTRLQKAIEQAVDFYHQRLLTARDGGAARSYLRSRGYDGEIVRRYRLGYAPAGWDNLARSLRLSDTDWVDAGLGNLNRHGGQYDFFRDRVLFPIFDAQDRPLGFGGRVLPGSDDTRKYVNSADSAVYNKSRVLYGLNWAKTAIVESNEVIVCEGYTDVLGFAQAGLPRAVATCGTALTDEHVKLLARFAKRVILAFDADAAGQNAAARFYEWERMHSLDVAVADLPSGQDPGDLARHDPARLAAAVTEAKPFLAFRVHRALEAGSLDTAEGRARAATEALAMVAEHPDPIVRDQYVLDIAAYSRVEPDLLRRQLADGVTRERGALASTEQGSRRPRSLAHDAGELEALRLVISRRDEMLPLLSSELFVDEVCALAFHHLATTAEVHAAMDAGGPEVADLLSRLSVEETTAEPNDNAALLWRRFLERMIQDLQYSVQQRSRQGLLTDPAELSVVQDQLKWCRERRELLSEPGSQTATVQSLLAWLRQPSEEAS